MTSGGAAGPDADYPSVALAHGDYAAEIGLFGGALKALTYRGAPLVAVSYTHLTLPTKA